MLLAGFSWVWQLTLLAEETKVDTNTLFSWPVVVAFCSIAVAVAGAQAVSAWRLGKLSEAQKAANERDRQELEDRPKREAKAQAERDKLREDFMQELGRLRESRKQDLDQLQQKLSANLKAAQGENKRAFDEIQDRWDQQQKWNTKYTRKMDRMKWELDQILDNSTPLTIRPHEISGGHQD
jgi:DNA anti-recombination protein RmuC